MKKSSLIIFILLILFQSCEFSSSISWKNGEISDDVLDEVEDINEKVFNMLKANDVNGIKELMSDTLLKIVKDKSFDFSEFKTLESYTIKDQYYFKSINTNGDLSGESEVYPEGNLNFKFKNHNTETYVALMCAKGGPGNEIMISAVYGKYEDKWKLNVLQSGQYSFNGKTAQDFYESAQLEFSKGYFINAANSITFAKKCGDPLQDLGEYENVEDMKAFYDSVMNVLDSKYKLPIMMEAINTRPEIFDVKEVVFNEGIFPMVYYKTSINLDDTAKIHQECTSLHQRIGSLFYGIDKEKGYLIYRAFDNIPDGEKERYYVQFGYKLDDEENEEE